MCYIHTIGNVIQPLKTKEILSHATTQITLENIARRETDQSPKGKCCVIPFIAGTWSSKIIETESRVVVARSWKRGEGGLFSGYRASVWRHETNSADGWC